MPRCAPPGASLRGPLAPAPPFPPALGDRRRRRRRVLAQPAAGRPQLEDGGEASSSGGPRARGAGVGSGRSGAQLAFSGLPGQGRAGAAGPPPARRAAEDACRSPSRSARLWRLGAGAPLPSLPRPSGPQRRPLRELHEDGGAWLCGGHDAGAELGRLPVSVFPGSGGSSSAASPALGGRDREAAAPPGGAAPT